MNKSRHHATYWLLLIGGLIGWLTLSSTVATAQNAQGIVAVVNDRIITNYDLTQRILILQRSGEAQKLSNQPRRLRSLALNQLIDERLQEDEASKSNITLNDIEMRRARNIVERNIGVGKGRLAEFLQSSGIDPLSFDEKIHAEMIWNKILRRRALPNINIPEADIDAELDRLKRGQNSALQSTAKEKLLQVNFAYGNNPSDDLRARLLDSATDLSKTKVSCETLPSTAPGFPGAQLTDLGDIQVEDLRERMQAAIKAVPKGQISKPVTSDQGISLFMICPTGQGTQNLPSRDRIKEFLARSRLDRRSKRMLREIRQSATIDIRN